MPILPGVHGVSFARAASRGNITAAWRGRASRATCRDSDSARFVWRAHERTRDGGVEVAIAVRELEAGPGEEEIAGETGNAGHVRE